MNNIELKNKLKLCFLVALEVIFCFTPLGSIPIGPIVATLSMIPVIVTSLTFGKKCGMLLGLTFAIFSLIYWTFILPSFPTAFLFSPFASFATYNGNAFSLIICFVPRILGGLVPAAFNDAVKCGDDKKKKALAMVFASILGSLTNTILVLLFILLFFSKEYAAIAEKAIFTVLGLTVITNGVPEAIICGITCPILANIIKKV